MPKHALRRLMLDQRSRLSSSAREEASRIIQKSFLESPLFDQTEAIALYAPIRGEVDTSLVLQACLVSGKKVLFPAVGKGQMTFKRVTVPEEMQIGAYGIPEPHATCVDFDLGAIDVFVVPGVVFDLAGNRVGYGKGYYDRTLHPLEGHGKLCGFCYDFQLVDHIVGEPHDVMMDRIITERRAIEVSSGLHR